MQKMNATLATGHHHARNPEPIIDDEAKECIRLACGPVTTEAYDFSKGCMYLVAMDANSSPRHKPSHKYIQFKPKNAEKAVVNHKCWVNQKYYISGQQVPFPVKDEDGKKKHPLTPFAYRNIVIDIDCHNDSVSDADRVEMLATYVNDLTRNYIDVGLIPDPNFIVHTPRGLHLWWCLIPTSNALEYFWQRAIDNIISYCQGCLNENPQLSLLEIDETASKRSGLYRMPGSYDSTHQVYCYADLHHGTRMSIFDFLSIVDPEFKPITKVQRAKALAKRQEGIDSYNRYVKYHAAEEARKISHTKINVSYNELRSRYIKSNIYRLNFTDWLIHSRYAETGTREILLFAYYNAAIQLYPPEMAIEKLTAVNKIFKSPLAPNELTHIIAVFQKRDKDGEIEAYNYKTANWYKLVQATPDEIEKFGKPLPPNGTRDLKRKANKQKKEEKYRRAYDLHKKGLSIRQIAQKVGISTKTVQKIIHTYNDMDETTDKLDTHTTDTETREENNKLSIPTTTTQNTKAHQTPDNSSNKAIIQATGSQDYPVRERRKEEKTLGTVFTTLKIGNSSSP